MGSHHRMFSATDESLLLLTSRILKSAAFHPQTRSAVTLLRCHLLHLSSTASSSSCARSERSRVATSKNVLSDASMIQLRSHLCSLILTALIHSMLLPTPAQLTFVKSRLTRRASRPCLSSLAPSPTSSSASTHTSTLTVAWPMIQLSSSSALALASSAKTTSAISSVPKERSQTSRSPSATPPSSTASSTTLA